ncbi:beta 1-4 rhamnosyltransferase Cps2T [Paenibacillus sp. SAF-054]|uniref:beta 1-4 rhamnosyltransferase Cps2T n=1 Tax=unclassified Paenibacillus TaxID=185978 RepID=UPI003F81F72A
MAKHVFIIGSKGIPAKYGGFETFVDQLTARRINKETRYHVACLADRSGEFEHNGARCFQVRVLAIGSARAVLYDLLSLRECIRYIGQHRLTDCVIYILACRIGPFFYPYKRKLEKLGVTILVNPDGHEWKRGKWNAWIKRYWKLSERLMVKHADLLVCDSRGIETYIRDDYARYRPRTTFIAYGADLAPSTLGSGHGELSQWMNEHGLQPGEYYLVIGRFVPENNYELMIKEFMTSETTKDLVIVTGVEHNSFYEELLEKCRFDLDPRVKFVGTVYDEQLLKKIRELAYGYCHGHEVGGTNPSLLEALASTKLNLLFDVVFNREVGGDGAVYFSADPGSFAGRIRELDQYDEFRIKALEAKAKARISTEYTWERIVRKYEHLFHSFEVFHKKPQYARRFKGEYREKLKQSQ